MKARGCGGEKAAELSWQSYEPELGMVLEEASLRGVGWDSQGLCWGSRMGSVRLRGMEAPNLLELDG